MTDRARSLQLVLGGDCIAAILWAEAQLVGSLHISNDACIETKKLMESFYVGEEGWPTLNVYKELLSPPCKITRRLCETHNS
jgi:hypothetical protein